MHLELKELNCRQGVIRQVSIFFTLQVIELRIGIVNNMIMMEAIVIIKVSLCAYLPTWEIHIIQMKTLIVNNWYAMTESDN